MEKFDLSLKYENDKTSDYYLEKQEFEWEPVEGTKHGLKKVNNTYLPMLVKNLDSVKKLEIREDDTFVIGYPKSGTTWVEEIVWLLQNNLDYEKARSKFHFKRILFIDRGVSKGTLEDTKSPRVLKSHLRKQFLPDNFEKTAKVVYVMRNPKDVVVSSYNFIKTLKEEEFIGSFEQMIENFLQGKFWYGSWWDHIKEYLAMEGIFIVKYEELLEEPLKVVRSLVDYLGKSYTDSQIVNIISFCSFDKMKDYPSFNFAELIEFNFFDEKFNFFRKGQIGNWKKHLSDEISQKIDDMIEKELGHEVQFKFFPSSENQHEK